MGAGRVAVPVRASPLVKGGRACGAGLLGNSHVARGAGNVVVRDDRRAHWLQRPVGGVSPGGGRKEV